MRIGAGVFSVDSPPSLTQNISSNLCRIHLRGCAVTTSDSAPIPPLGQCKYQKQLQPTIVLSKVAIILSKLTIVLSKLTIGSWFLEVGKPLPPPETILFQLQSYNFFFDLSRGCLKFCAFFYCIRCRSSQRTFQVPSWGKPGLWGMGQPSHPAHIMAMAVSRAPLPGR